jgi:hypothetical protein
MRFLDYFDNFLKSKRKYKENQAFWRLAIAIWCEETYEEIPSDGSGNPILYVVFPHLKKSLRIIQRQKTDETLPFLAHIEKKEFNIFESDELIISLQLNKDTYQDTEKLFKAFIYNEINNQQLERINGKYVAIW